MLKLLIELIGFLTILITPNPTGQPAYLEKAQLIECFANHWTSVQYLNHLFKLCHDGIKLLFLQKRSTSFSWIKLGQRSTSKNKPDTQYRKCSVSSTNFSTCNCPVYLGRLAENYKTLHRLVPLEKLLGRSTRRPAKGTISRPLLREVTYGMLLLLLIM